MFHAKIVASLFHVVAALKSYSLPKLVQSNQVLTNVSSLSSIVRDGSIVPEPSRSAGLSLGALYKHSSLGRQEPTPSGHPATNEEMGSHKTEKGEDSVPSGEADLSRVEKVLGQELAPSGEAGAGEKLDSLPVTGKGRNATEPLSGNSSESLGIVPAAPAANKTSKKDLYQNIYKSMKNMVNSSRSEGEVIVPGSSKALSDAFYKEWKKVKNFIGSNEEADISQRCLLSQSVLLLWIYGLRTFLIMLLLSLATYVFAYILISHSARWCLPHIQGVDLRFLFMLYLLLFFPAQRASNEGLETRNLQLFCRNIIEGYLVFLSLYTVPSIILHHLSSEHPLVAKIGSGKVWFLRDRQNPDKVLQDTRNSIVLFLLILRPSACLVLRVLLDPQRHPWAPFVAYMMNFLLLSFGILCPYIIMGGHTFTDLSGIVSGHFEMSRLVSVTLPALALGQDIVLLVWYSGNECGAALMGGLLYLIEISLSFAFLCLMSTPENHSLIGNRKGVDNSLFNPEEMGDTDAILTLLHILYKIASILPTGLWGMLQASTFALRERKTEEEFERVIDGHAEEVEQDNLMWDPGLVRLLHELSTSVYEHDSYLHGAQRFSVHFSSTHPRLTSYIAPGDVDIEMGEKRKISVWPGVLLDVFSTRVRSNMVGVTIFTILSVEALLRISDISRILNVFFPGMDAGTTTMFLLVGQYMAATALWFLVGVILLGNNVFWPKWTLVLVSAVLGIEAGYHFWRFFVPKVRPADILVATKWSWSAFSSLSLQWAHFMIGGVAMLGLFASVRAVFGNSGGKYAERVSNCDSYTRQRLIGVSSQEHHERLAGEYLRTLYSFPTDYPPILMVSGFASLLVTLTLAFFAIWFFWSLCERGREMQSLSSQLVTRMETVEVIARGIYDIESSGNKVETAKNVTSSFFSHFDRNPADGMLCPEELSVGDWLQAIGTIDAKIISPENSKKIGLLWFSMDTSGDGCLNRNETASYLTNLTSLLVSSENAMVREASEDLVDLLPKNPDRIKQSQNQVIGKLKGKISELEEEYKQRMAEVKLKAEEAGGEPAVEVIEEIDGWFRKRKDMYQKRIQKIEEALDLGYEAVEKIKQRASNIANPQLSSFLENPVASIFFSRSTGSPGADDNSAKFNGSMLQESGPSYLHYVSLAPEDAADTFVIPKDEIEKEKKQRDQIIVAVRNLFCASSGGCSSARHMHQWIKEVPFRRLETVVYLSGVISSLFSFYIIFTCFLGYARMFELMMSGQADGTVKGYWMKKYLSTYFDKSTLFPGVLLSTCIFAWFSTFLMLNILLGVCVFPQFWVSLWNYRRLLIFLVVTKLIDIFLIRRVLLNRLIIHNGVVVYPRFFSWLWVVLCLINFALGMVAAVARLACLLPFIVWKYNQLDQSLLPSQFVGFDSGYSALLMLTLFGYEERNPIKSAFLKSVNPSIDSLYTYTKEPSLPEVDARKTRKKVTNRFWLALTLHHNPSLQKLRKHSILPEEGKPT